MQEKDCSKNVARNVKRFRLCLNLTQKELSFRSGVSVLTIRRLEHGGFTEKDVPILTSISQALNRSIFDMLREPRLLGNIRFCCLDDNWC